VINRPVKAAERKPDEDESDGGVLDEEAVGAGAADGAAEGAAEGRTEGKLDVISVGAAESEGALVGISDGISVGATETEGAPVGIADPGRSNNSPTT
jgi:hypothetical protein